MDPKKLLVACLSATLMASCLAAGATERIEFWTMSMKPKFTPYFESIVQRYEADHPDIKLDWVDYPWDVLQAKLEARVKSGIHPPWST
jgi:putative chitobiose transport system substrate-binding protein